jgi:uncharacterized protein (TIGR02145 family)
MKSASGWYADGNGINSSGFTAFPGGVRYGYGCYDNIGRNGKFWSASEINNYFAWFRVLCYVNSGVLRDFGGKGGGFSVRCVRD